MTEAMQKQALQLFNHPIIKGLLSQIRGVDQILSMLSTPLSEPKTDYVKKISENYVKKISEKIQNDRKKNKKTRRKNKMR
jgi:reverse gyrase